MRPASGFLVMLLVGCALTGKSKPLEVRYFSPEAVRTVAAPVTAASGLELRLGRVSGATYIKDEIVYRDVGQELGFYAGRRWAEAPQDYVRRALTRELFQVRAVRQVVAGAGLTLDVELETFEERRAARAARVELSWRLRNDKVVLVQRTVTVERPITRADGDAVATAMAGVLAEALDRVVADVVTELGVHAAPPPAPAGSP